MVNRNFDLPDTIVALQRSAEEGALPLDLGIQPYLNFEDELDLVDTIVLQQGTSPATMWIYFLLQRLVFFHENVALAETPTITEHAKNDYDWRSDDGLTGDATWDLFTWSSG